MKRLFYYMTLLAAVLLTAACADNEATNNEESLPEGMGRIRITICTPENNPNLTRAVNDTPWEDPNCEWEWLHDFHILICQESTTQTGKYEVKSIISSANWTEVAHTGDDNVGTSNSMSSTHKSAEVTSEPLPAGDYYIFAVANLADYTNYAKGKIIDPDETVKYTNGYSATTDEEFEEGKVPFGAQKNIPMTGKLMDGANLKKITVNNAKETPAGTITVWRVMAKMQFEFFNETEQKITIKGIEVESINQASATNGGIYLFSKDDLTSEVNLKAPTFTNVASNVTATWALHETMQTEGTTSDASYFSQAQLSWGPKLQSTGERNIGDGTMLQKFKPTVQVSGQDEEAAIILAVKPQNGLTFTPTLLSFTASRIGTDGGKIDVVEISNGTSKDVVKNLTPNRSKNNAEDTGRSYKTEYEYDLTGSATEGIFYVKIYIYSLANNKEYAFGDFVITGDVKSTDGTTAEGITLPAAALTDVGPVAYAPSTALVLNAGEEYDASTNPSKTLFFYVNETDATYTTINNQLSLRFKIQRGNGPEEEIRYGMTTPYIDGGAGGNGFNVIRRNDWIHIPVVLRDWTFRVEPLPFVPIAGYPAVTLSSDALTTTFSTGGYVILKPFTQKNNDGIWCDFSDPEVTFVSMSWKNSDGTDESGTGKIIETPFTYDNVNKCITGVLNNTLTTGTYMTTVTINTKLGPTGSQYDYSFTFNIVLDKTTN